MKTEWLIKYENSNIKVINTWFQGEKLFVNDKLQDERFGIASSDLTGHIITAKGERKNIKVHLGGFYRIECSAFIDDEKIIAEKIS